MRTTADQARWSRATCSALFSKSSQGERSVIAGWPQADVITPCTSAVTGCRWSGLCAIERSHRIGKAAKRLVGQDKDVHDALAGIVSVNIIAPEGIPQDIFVSDD